MASFNRTCVFYAKNCCSKGDQCPYLHSAAIVQSSTNTQHCSFYSHGTCMKGTSCSFLHSKNPQEKLGTCKYYVKGTCKNGESCPFVHNENQIGMDCLRPPSSLQHNDIASDAPQKHTPICKYYHQGVCKNGDTCTYSHHSKQVSVESIDGSIDVDGLFQCIFGNGLEVINLITDSTTKKTNRIHISGLSEYIKDDDIKRVLIQFGFVEELVRKHSTYCFVIFSSTESAESAVKALNGTLASSIWKRKVHKQDTIVSVRLAVESSSVITQHSTVKLMWYRRTRVGWAHFLHKWQAEKAADSFTGQILREFPITATFQKPKKNQTTSFSVVISGIPDQVSKKQLSAMIENTAHVKPSSITLDPYKESREVQPIIMQFLQQFGPLESFELLHSDKVSLKCKAIAKFLNSEDASKAAAMKKLRCVEMDDTDIFISKICTAKFSIPSLIYGTIEPNIRAVMDECDSSIRFRIFQHEGSGVVNSNTVVSLSGDHPKIVASAKSRLQRVLAGERFMKAAENDGGAEKVLWIDFFSSPVAATTLKQIGIDSGTFISRNLRRRELIVYGSSLAKTIAHEAVIQYIAAISNQSFSIVVPSPAWKPLLIQGLKLINNVRGVSHSSLDLDKRTVTVVGDSASRDEVIARITALVPPTIMEKTNHIDSSIELQPCPICMCPSEPNENGEIETVTLSCSHVYCQGCFDMWMKQSCRGDASCSNSFPLKCLAPECSTALSVQELLMHAGAQYKMLLRAAVDEYILAHLEKFQFCFTPNCEKIFTRSEARLVFCSSCKVTSCTVCEVEEHEGISCEEHRREKAPTNEQRNRILEDILTLKCPRCAKAFLDFEGCFALKCSACPCAFCGWCLHDCGSDAHSHVRGCSSKPTGADAYFGTLEQFKAAMKSQMIRKLNSFLSTKSRAEKVEICASIAMDLRDLGIALDSDFNALT